jgi:hypothetical protein
MTHLIFASASFHIPNYSFLLRENEYYFCLKQLLRVVPSNFDLVICDNSIQSVNDLHSNELKEELKKVKFMILNRNIGSKNIGMGELDELIYVHDNVDFTKYDKIVYFTLRKFIINPYVFEKVNSMQKNALLSNPPFLHIKNNFTFNYSEPTPNLYNDMFFSLSSNVMINYVKYSKDRINYNLQNEIGSEQNLFNFINGNKIEYEWMDSLGFIRIDYRVQNEIQLI